MSIRVRLAFVVAVGVASPALADIQALAPGTAQQDAMVVSTGPNGLCETTAASGDIQYATVGDGLPFRPAVHCGNDRIADTTAAGDDVQRLGVGARCETANSVVVDNGEDGIPNSAKAATDDYVGSTVVGVAPANTRCVTAGEDGRAQTTTVAGDDVLLPNVPAVNAAVVRCGPNLVANTTANNVNPVGDDVQALPVGAACADENVIVVSAGPNGIADPRAEGVDLLLSVAKATRITIPPRRVSLTKKFKLTITNREFGAGAPAGRTVRLFVDNRGCPANTVTLVDVDTSTPGTQGTVFLERSRSVRAQLEITLGPEDTVSVDGTRTPQRCNIDLTAEALDTVAIDPDAYDDADLSGFAENNQTTLALDVSDAND